MHAINLCISMAALSISPLYHNKHSPVILVSSTTNTSDSRSFSTTVCCQNRDQDRFNNTKTKKEIINKENKRLMLQKFLGGVMEKFGSGVKDNLSPKQKGDWKDITLMSTSFAVYIYMSQKIVCAYCAWMSEVRHPW